LKRIERSKSGLIRIKKDNFLSFKFQVKKEERRKKKGAKIKKEKREMRKEF
jgi:hypothetical protein